MEATQALATWAAGLEARAIPQDVRQQCRNLLLDALACAVAGHQGDETAQVAAFANALAAGSGSGVIAGGEASLASAVILNAYLITAVTMCDAHRATLTHVTPEVVPPALAIAERDDVSGADFLAALAAGLEVTARVGLGLDFAAFRARGFHGPGVLGPFGAAAATGRLLRFDGAAMARAFGLAGSQAAGTFAAWGTPTVKFHQCRGALSGLMAALLAQQGFVANPDFLTHDDGGLFSAYCGNGFPEKVTSRLGERWELTQIALRPWPAAAAIQGLVTALFDLLRRQDVPVSRIAQVRIWLGQRAFDMHGGFARYSGKFQAMLSAHYAAAAVLHDHDLSLDQFEPARYEAPELMRFAAETVQIELDAGLPGPAARVELRMADGAAHSARCDHTLGSPENPMTAAQVETKFRRYASGRLGTARTEAVIRAVAGLEGQESMRGFMRLLRC